MCNAFSYGRKIFKVFDITQDILFACGLFIQGKNISEESKNI